MKSRRMMTRSAVMTLVLCWGASIGIPAIAGAEDLSARELKKLSKQADRALKSGQIDQATELFREVLDGTTPGDTRRADALYQVALSHLAAQPRDGAAAQPLLDELAEISPRHPRNLEVDLLRAFLDEIAEARTEIETGAKQLAEQSATFEAERQRAEEEQQKISGESAAKASDQIRSLEAQLRRARSDLATTREELEKKEEALERLLRQRSQRSSG